MPRMMCSGVCTHTHRDIHRCRHVTMLLEVTVTGLSQTRYSPAVGIPVGLIQINISSVSAMGTSLKGYGFWLRWVPKMQFNSAYNRSIVSRSIGHWGQP